MSDELLEVFATEAREMIERAGDDLIALEADRADAAALESLFRAIHTLKGSAGLVSFREMDQLFHAAEDRLAEVRSGKAALDADLLLALNRALEIAEGWTSETERRGAIAEPGEAWEPLRAVLAASGRPEASAVPRASGGPSAAWAAALGASTPTRPVVAIRYAPAANSYFLGEDPLAVLAAAPELLRLEADLTEPVGDPGAYDPFRCAVAFRALSAAPIGALREAFRLWPDQIELVELAQSPDREAAAQTDRQRPARTLRVGAADMDALGAAADELVVAKNALAHLTSIAAERCEPQLARAMADARAALDRQASRLHERIMRLRMTPLSALFRRLPRPVRETAATLAKEVDFVARGGEIEIDKSVADGLFEPLLHLLRNALDHGIEPAEIRRASGKSARGEVRLSARSDSDDVVIEVADDGRGVDLEAVRATAVARGVAQAADVEALSDRAALELVFAPGFSTAPDVSALSGRGVGMDAVRHAVEALGGSVRLDSTPGKGACAVLRLPVRIRLARLMMVEAGGESYAIPIEDVVETARVKASALTSVRDGRAFVWREQAVPVVAMSSLLGRAPTRTADDEVKLLIIRTDDETTALAVDRVGERVEAPVRPLDGLLSGLPGLAGTTLLGDGRLLMVLHPAELIG